MSKPAFIFDLPEISPSERTPVVEALLSMVDRQQELICRQAKEVEALKDEVRKLKGASGRPKLKASRLNGPSRPGEEKPKKGSSEGDTRGKGKSGGHRRTGAVPVKVVEQRVELEVSGADWEFKGYRDYGVEDLVLEGIRRHYRLAHWRTPEGKFVTAKVPLAVRGGHFGPALVSYVLHQHHGNRVPQKLLLEQLWDLGVEISAGELNRLLTEPGEGFHEGTKKRGQI